MGTFYIRDIDGICILRLCLNQILQSITILMLIVPLKNVYEVNKMS